MGALASIRLPKWFGGLSLGGKRVLGIDDGSQVSKVAQAKMGSSGLEVSICEVLGSTESLSLQDWLTENRLAKSPAAFSLSDDNVQSQAFTLPSNLEGSELETAIEWEVKKHIPSPDFAYHDVLTSDGVSNTEFKCVMAPKEVVLKHFKRGQELGLAPKYLETESSALIALMEAVWPDEVLDRIAFLDLGFSAFRLTFVHDGQVSFSRTLYFGLSTIASQAATQLDVGIEVVLPQLLEFLHEGVGQDVGLLNQLLQESLYTLGEEFGRSEFYAREQSGLGEVGKVFLWGGGAGLKGVTDYLRTHMGEREVVTLNPLEEASKIGAGIEKSVGPVCACAIGLALREG